MSSDASAAAASPMTNGTSCSEDHREADASTTSDATRSLAEVCADLNQRVTNFLNATPGNELTRRTQEQARISIGVVEQALQDYSFDALSLSYNGGKDCLVLLILYLSTLHAHYTHKSRSHDFPASIPAIYAKPPDPFPSVTSFVDSSSAQYHLDLTHISTNPGTRPTPSKAKSHSSPPVTNSSDPLSPTTGSPESGKIVTFRDAFALYLSARPQVKAIFVGTRRTDPHGAHLTYFAPTDGNWPPFMRIHPVIDWHLSEIWTFLRSPYLADPNGPSKTLDYCAMYDEGYTSLGGIGDTLRNPKLRYIDSESGEEKYKPAYALTEDGEERLGRE